MLAPELVTPPSELDLVVPIDEVREYLGVTTSDNDKVIDALIRSATKYLDAWDGVLGGHCLAEQTWSQAFDGFPCGEFWSCQRSNTMQNVLRLKLFPVIEIISVKYYDSDGAVQTVSSSDYRVLTDALGPFVTGLPGAATPWPASTYSRPDAVIVEAKFGYVEVPEPIKIAICMKVARMFSLSRLGSISTTSGIVRSETVDGIGSQTFGSGSDVIQIMQHNTETEEYLLGPYMRGWIA